MGPKGSLVRAGRLHGRRPALRVTAFVVEPLARVPDVHPD